MALPEFVVKEIAATCEGKHRNELIWPAQDGGCLSPPTNKSWMAGAVARCHKADETFPRITAHALRHTAASLAISAGERHADLFDDDFTAVADKLSETVGKVWAHGR